MLRPIPAIKIMSSDLLWGSLLRRDEDLSNKLYVEMKLKISDLDLDTLDENHTYIGLAIKRIR